MKIEIHQPELEALIQQRMASGAFRNVEDALIDALKSSAPSEAPPRRVSNRTGADGMAAMQAMPYKDEIEFGGSRLKNASFLELSKSVRGLLTDEEVDTLFARDQSFDRPIDLS